MHDDGLLRITSDLAIPSSEILYRATRSGGPGGQHVNTSSTRVQLTWNLRTSAALTEDQRSRLLDRLAARLDGEGNLRITASTTRSQHRNREEATERFRALIARALEVRPPRRKTRPPRSAAEARLQEKKRRSEVKQKRRPVEPD